MLSAKEQKELNKANELMNRALKLIYKVVDSNKDFNYGCQSLPIQKRLEGSISQLECVDGIQKISDL
jgi:hypothetical protein